MLLVFAWRPVGLPDAVGVPLAVLGYAVVCAFQGALFAVFAVALRVAWARTRWPMVALLPLALVATEFVYPLLFQSYTGAALMPRLELMQLGDLGGPLLSSALVAVASGALCDVLLGSTARKIAALIITALAFGGAGIYGTVRIAETDRREQSAPHRKTSIAQPNVGEIELHKDPNASVHAVWSEAAEAHSRAAEIQVWPEAAFNHFIDIDDPRWPARIQHGVPMSIIAGIMRFEGKKLFNSSVLIDKAGRITGHFDKIQLLAFGEYTPFSDWFPILNQWSPNSSSLTRGTTTAPLVDGAWKYATFICYEDILAELVQKTMRDDGHGRPHVLVNLTNDSWYGDGFEQRQHLTLAAMRTIEHRRWMVRATSTGISAFIDASGRIVQHLPLGKAGVMVKDVPMLSGETVFERFGQWPGWLALGVLIAGTAIGRRRQPQPLPRGA
jgi:apolipoprotein N-acyltransferase